MTRQRRRLEKLNQDAIVNHMRDRPERFVEAADHIATDGQDQSRSWRPGRGIPVKPQQGSVLAAPGMSLQWHDVVPGQYHTLLRVTPTNQEAYAQDPRFRNIDDQGRRYATIGAGRDFWGSLVSNTNRENDIEPHEPGIPISPPGGMSEDALISLMLKADRDYPDDLNYDFLPHPASAACGRGGRTKTPGEHARL